MRLMRVRLGDTAVGEDRFVVEEIVEHPGHITYRVVLENGAELEIKEYKTGVLEVWATGNQQQLTIMPSAPNAVSIKPVRYHEK